MKTIFLHRRFIMFDHTKYCNNGWTWPLWNPYTFIKLSFCNCLHYNKIYANNNLWVVCIGSMVFGTFRGRSRSLKFLRRKTNQCSIVIRIFFTFNMVMKKLQSYALLMLIMNLLKILSISIPCLVYGNNEFYNEI